MASQRSSSWLLTGILVLGVGLIGLLPVGLIVGGLQERRVVEPVRGGITTTGTVVDSEENDSVALHGTTTYDPVISFSDRDGHVHLFTSTTVDDKPRVGTTVRVSYDPADPSRASNLSVGAGRWKGFVFTGIGLLVLELGLAGWVLVLRLRRRARPAPVAPASEKAPGL